MGCENDYKDTSCLFDKYDKADEVIKDYLFIGEVNGRRRFYIKELIDDNVNQCVCSGIQCEKYNKIKNKKFNKSFQLCL